MQDDNYHEIQLNGKQLVFLFMATTVVSVVIFLCGVLVGRSVRTQRESLADPSPTTSAATEGTAPQPAPAPASPADSSAQAQAQAKSPTADRFTYPDLENPKASVEPLKPASDKAARSPTHAEPAAREEHTARADKPTGSAGSVAPHGPAPEKSEAASGPQSHVQDTAPSAESAASEPAGQGFAVQIAALNARSEADAIAKRLASKGYAAYVLAPPSGTPPVFRVRVGKFSTRREAETVAAKLQKEEQFKPWVTR
jgi:cell division septation protein DedD